MNGAHLHLIFTHLPIVGLGFALLLNAWALYRKSDELRRLTLRVYALVGLFALLAFVTGDGAEKLLETYPGYGEEQIRPHEHQALLLFVGLMIAAAVALIGLYVASSNAKALTWFCLALLIMSLFLGYVAYRTGATGGAIRHIEIEKGYYPGN